MRRTSAVGLVFVTLCSLLSAQQRGSSQRGTAVLEVSGVKLHLGMTKAEVTEKLSGTGISKINEDNWVVGAMEDLGPSLQFTNGRLNYADRYWVSYDNDIVEAMFGAVNSLNQEGFSACTVTAITKTLPDSTGHNVWIICGEKSILISRRSFGGKSYNSVHEQLGGMHGISN
jgi:hypothetical protein